MYLSCTHCKCGQQKRCKQAVRPEHGVTKNDEPDQHNDQSSEQDNPIQTKQVVYLCQNDLRQPFVRNARKAYCTEGKDVSGGNVMGLQDQVPV